MQAVTSSILELAISNQWLVAANFILSVLLALWMLRYRWLYLASCEAQANNRDLIDNLSEGIYRSSPDGRQLSANPALVRLNGYGSEAEMLEAVRCIATEWYVEPGRREEFRRLLERDGFVTDFVSEVYRHKTRERIWISECARIVRDRQTGQALFFEGSVREITETVRRLSLEKLYCKLTSQVPGGLFQIVRDRDGRYSFPYVSDGFRQIAGMKGDDPLPGARTLLRLVDGRDRRAFVGSMRESARLAERWDCEFRIADETGRGKWLRLTATPEIVADGVIWHGYVTDISRRKESELAIEKLAFNDPLTELPNRRVFLDRVETAMHDCARHDRHAALLYLDLDNFKRINDTHGHDSGDAYLKQVALRLRASVDGNDVVARIGGDEFVVLIEGADQERACTVQLAVMAANRLLSSLRREFDIGEASHRSSASIGVVVFNGAEASTDEILKRADTAMYRVKAAGRDGMALYDQHAEEGAAGAPSEVTERLSA